MTREDLFRAAGEVREDQIESAKVVKKQVRPWRRFGALAACLALIVTAVTAAPWIQDQIWWKALMDSFTPGLVVNGEESHWRGMGGDNSSSADSGGGAEAGGLDGSYYGTGAVRQGYSANVEIGELGGVQYGGDHTVCLTLDTKWLSEEELFAQDTVVFRGTVRQLQYYQVEPEDGNTAVYFTRVIVDVTDPIRGDMAAGETTSVLWLGAKGYMTTSLIGPLENLNVGSDAIFMPMQTTSDTGWREGGSYFCYADLAELYLGEGMRYVFADTAEGVDFGRDAYPSLAKAETMEELAAGIRERLEEKSQPAAVPPAPQPEPRTPQAEPSKTVQAGDVSAGPAGALELPGGALAGDGEKPGDGQ